MYEYNSVLVYLVLCVAIAVLMIVATNLLVKKDPDAQKVSIYECGFDPIGDSRQKFEVRFFLVAILFIIFDLEISFLFPWSVVLSEITSFGYWTMIVFLFILTVGFIYEWFKGGLEWE